MSDPRKVLPALLVSHSRSHQSSNSGEFADFHSDTSSYFEAWLEDLKPALQPQKPELNTQPANDVAPLPGELIFEGTLVVDCYVSGRLRSLTGTLIVSEPAEVESDIVVATAIIDGVLHGDIHASERVELQSHARVIGNIESPNLAIQPGAIFEGHCHFPKRGY